MTDAGTPIAYTALAKGVPVVSSDGHRIGTVELVLQVPEEDLFDGIVVHTHKGLRFVDRDSIDQITTSQVTCTISADAAAALPEPDAPPNFRADALEDAGESLHDVFGRMFGRPHWQRDKD